jgi:uncharacterized membrane protein
MNTFLLWLHFMGLALAFAGGFGAAQVGPRLASASESERPLLGSLQRAFGIMNTVGFALLLVSGPLLVWLKFGGFASMPTPWFHVKMALVALIIIAVGGQQIAARRFRNGDTAALRWMMIFGQSTGILAILTVLAAVLAFQ